MDANDVTSAIAQAKANQSAPPPPPLPPAPEKPADVATVVKVPTIEQLPPKTAWGWFWSDIHTNAPALFGFACAVGMIWGPPEYKQKFADTLVAAGTYLFASSKAKN
jgi:hypothetical protein